MCKNVVFLLNRMTSSTKQTEKQTEMGLVETNWRMNNEKKDLECVSDVNLDITKCSLTPVFQF